MPVVDADEGVVGRGEADAFRRQLTRQPAVTIAVELQAERCPGRHPQIDQAKLGIDEIEIVVQALAAVRPHEGLVRLLVMPRLVGAARLHRRDDMHQAGVIATPFQHLRHDRFLADVALGDVLDRDPRLRCQRCRPLAHAVAQRRGKLRVIEDANPDGVEKPRHSLGVAHRGKRPGHHHPVVTGQHAGDPIVIALRERPRHLALDSFGTGGRYYPLFGSGSAGLGTGVRRSGLRSG